MKVPKIFTKEKGTEEKINDYLNRVEYVQKPYDEDELGIGATVYLSPEMITNSQKKEMEEKFVKYLSSHTVVIDSKEIETDRDLGIGAADTSPKFLGLNEKELEKKLLEDYTTLP